MFTQFTWYFPIIGTLTVYHVQIICDSFILQVWEVLLRAGWIFFKVIKAKRFGVHYVRVKKQTQ